VINKSQFSITARRGDYANSADIGSVGKAQRKFHKRYGGQLSCSRILSERGGLDYEENIIVYDNGVLYFRGGCTKSGGAA
jgi:hypothetical protein